MLTEILAHIRDKLWLAATICAVALLWVLVDDEPLEYWFAAPLGVGGILIIDAVATVLWRRYRRS